jgi:hypothetical protein
MDGLENSLVFHASCLIFSFLTSYKLGQVLYVLLRPYPKTEATLWRQEQSSPVEASITALYSQSAIPRYYIVPGERPAGVMRGMVL